MRVDKFQTFLWAMCISFEGLTVPFPPYNVTIELTPHHVLVTWDPPMETNDEITMYVVSYSIFPDSRITMNNVTGGLRFCRIPVEGQEGRLLKIQVQAQNQVGIGNPSAARYARIGCGRTLWLDPSASTSLIHPETEGNYKTGFLCQWTFSTKDTCFLTFMFVTLQLVVYSNIPCIEGYVIIGNKGRFCHAQEEGKIIVSRDSNVSVIFNSGRWAPGKGFHLKITSIKPPGPPTSLTMTSSRNSVILTWAPPTGLTIPITSYVVRWAVLPDDWTFGTVLEPNQFHYSINTTRFVGKDLLISITARIEDVEGVTSNPLFFRALKPPGPPTALTMTSSRNSVILSWAPPTGLTIPITSYVIRYTFLPYGQTYVISLEPNTFHFSIDTTLFEGQDLLINITARIEDVEGVTSNPLFFRVLKPPGPPTALTMTSSRNSIIVRWAPPTGLTLPITSYVIRWAFLPDDSTFSTFLEPNTFHFNIDRRRFEGKDCLISITARIEDVEGFTSDPLFFKARK